MKKEQIIEAILNRISDPYTDNEEDIALCNPIELPYATTWLAEIRQEDIDNANDDEFRMPNAATPELLMEAFNCRVRLAKRNVTIDRLANYLIERGDVAMYENYNPDHSYGPDIYPLDFWHNFDSTADFPFGFGKQLTIEDVIELIEIGKNSHVTCCFTDDYVWYDAKNKVVHTTNDPYADGTIDARGFAEYALTDTELFDYIVDDMDFDTAKNVFEYLPGTIRILQKGEQ